jgi:RNA polymerase sigma factor (sigma-70 family)
MSCAIPQPGENGQRAPAVDWEVELARHEGWLRAVIARQGIEAEAVHDVFQEVARAAVEQRSPILDVTRVRGWLYRLACIHAVRHRRRMARQRRHEATFARLTVQAADDEDQDIPIVWLLSQERRELVRKGLTRLAPEDARLLRWKYFDQQSYRQLARRLRITEKAVDARLHRARQRLRATLTELSGEEEP